MYNHIQGLMSCILANSPGLSGDHFVTSGTEFLSLPYRSQDLPDIMESTLCILADFGNFGTKALDISGLSLPGG